jgi:hypothetical protein
MGVSSSLMIENLSPQRGSLSKRRITKGIPDAMAIKNQ